MTRLMGREGEKVAFSVGCEKLKSAVKQGVAHGENINDRNRDLPT